MTENDYKPNAESPEGSMGLMQLWDGLVSDINNEQTSVGKTCKTKVNDPFNPRQNILGGTCYLKYLFSILDTTDIELVAAAYNAGPGIFLGSRSANLNGLYNDIGKGKHWKEYSRKLAEIKNKKDKIAYKETIDYMPKVKCYYDKCNAETWTDLEDHNCKQ